MLSEPSHSCTWRCRPGNLRSGHGHRNIAWRGPGERVRSFLVGKFGAEVDVSVEVASFDCNGANYALRLLDGRRVEVRAIVIASAAHPVSLSSK